MKKRVERVNRLIKEELSKILFKEADFPSGALVTVVRAVCAPDLKSARVYMGCFPEEKTAEVMENLEKRIYFFQQELNKRLKMRPVPRVKFLREKEIRKSARIEEILEKIKHNESVNNGDSEGLKAKSEEL